MISKSGKEKLGLPYTDLGISGVDTLVRLRSMDTDKRAQEKSLDGTYTKMLRMVLGVLWREKISSDISCMGTYQNYQTRSGAEDLNWRDTALGILNFWPVILSHVGTGKTEKGGKKG